MYNYFFEKRDMISDESKTEGECPRICRHRRKAPLFFAATLVMIVLLTTALVLTEKYSGVTSPTPVPTMPVPAPSARPTTTVPRAPTGDGTVLVIEDLPEGEPHGNQQIYQENISSIVTVEGEQESASTQGTGVIFTDDGYIVTNAHVIEGCSAVSVVLNDGCRLDTLLTGMDRETDLAVLKVSADHLKPAVFGDSERLQVGDEVMAIGNPLGSRFRGTMTDGIISAINRDLQVDGYRMELIQTTAALNSGNSGGALINRYGQVIGITNMKMQSYSDTVEGLGFAIPASTVKRIADELIATGHISGRPTIGITVSQRPRLEAQAAGSIQGLRVEEVRSGSDAWEKGIRPGDWIVQAAGKRVRTIDELMEAKEGLHAGDVLHLTVFSAEEQEYMELDVLLMEQYIIGE